jgi:hypothetical protein
VPGWWHNGRVSPARIELTASTIQHWQHRNATARAFHRQKTLEKLHHAGITLTQTIRCKWP